MGLLNIPGLSPFVDANRGALLGLSSGLLSSPTISGGLSQGFANAAAARGADATYKANQQAETERQKGINQTAAWIQAKFPQYAALPADEAFQLALKDMSKSAAPPVDPTSTYQGRIDAGRQQGLQGTDLSTYALTGKLPSATAAAAASEPPKYRLKPDGTEEPVPGGAADLMSDPITTGNADAIMSGDQPPVLTGNSRYTPAIKAILGKQGYDLTKASQDWTATQKLFSTMNGAQQTRLRQATGQVSDSLDLVDQLAQQWKGGGFPILNKVNLVAATNGAYGKDAQSLATQLQTEIADMTGELANVYMGGNSPTDKALELAGQQLSADWSEDTFKNAVQLAKTNLAYRKNSLNLATAGIANSQYNQNQSVAPTVQVGPAGVTQAPTVGGPAPSSGDPELDKLLTQYGPH